MTPSPTIDPWLDPGNPLPPLRAHTAHIYLLETTPELEPLALPWLTVDERTRADRFRQAQARLHFLAGRAALRCLLAAHLNTTDTIPLTADTHGKLHLPASDLRFNLAHSGGRILIALTRNAAIGIDIEAVQSNRDLRLIAAKHFTAQENAALAEAEANNPTDPDSAFRNAFFHLWTRKEAALKADGRGLAFGLDRFEVPLTPSANCPITLPATSTDPSPHTFFVTGLDLPTPHHASTTTAPRFSAAVALSEPAFRLERYRFTSGCLTREHPHFAAPNDVS